MRFVLLFICFRVMHQITELVNQDCYGDAWMIVIELDDVTELDSLMDARAYADYLAQEAK